MENKQKVLAGLFAIVVVLALFWGRTVGRDQKPTESSSAASVSREAASTSGPIAAGTSAQAPAEAPAQRQPKSEDNDPLIGFLQEKDREGQWVIQRHTDGRPKHILGGRWRVNGGIQAMTEALKDLAPYLGVAREDLRLFTENEGVAMSNSSQLSQYHGRYRVYGGVIKAFANPKNQEIYHIGNDLRVIEDVDLRVDITREQAAEIAKGAAGTGEVTSMKISQDPLVFGTTPQNNQLAWRVFVTIQQPVYRSREILVSARDGKILMNQSLLRR